MAIRRFSNSSIATGAKSSKLWDGETFPGYFESIASAVVDSSGQAIITFDNIPQNYTHLQLRIVARTLGSGGTQEQYLKFNDYSTGYNAHYVYGQGGGANAVLAGGNTYSTVMWLTRCPDAAKLSNTFMSAVVDIYDYRNSNKNKTVKCIGGWNAHGTGEIWVTSGFSANTAPVTQITWRSNQNYIEGSRFSLYGIRSA